MHPKIKYWQTRILGDPSHTPLRVRIFYTANVLTCLMLAVVSMANLLAGVYGAAVLTLVIGLLHAGIYLLSKRWKLHRLALLIFSILCYAGVLVNYFVNDGIDGPSLFVFFFTFLLLIAVNDKKYHVYFVLATCGFAATLLFLEYTHKEWIVRSYNDDMTRISSLLLVFTIVLLGFFWIYRTLMDNYLIQKAVAERRAEELDRQHEQLKNLSEEKDKLFALVFHDLRGPLASVQQYLKSMSTGSLSDEIEQEMKSKLLTLTQETSSMLDNVLHWVYNQIDQRVLDIQERYVDEIVELSIDSERLYADRKEVYIFQDLTPGVKVCGSDFVAIDFTHFDQ